VRHTVVVVLAACSPGHGHIDAHPIDADPCGGVPLNQPVTGCVFGALDSMSLDGMWTLTATQQRPGADAVQITRLIYLTRNGSGPCRLHVGTQTSIFGEPTFDGYIDNTHAKHSYRYDYPHRQEFDWFLCVRDSDNALHWKSRFYSVMPGENVTTEGVLTR
jgi:hypothetical protein